MRKFLVFIACLAASGMVLAAAQSTVRGNPQHRAWIQEMKNSDRGPFARIRWFCKDGQILPPKPYGCGDFGGGVQHGQWSQRTVTLRKAGYQIANFYADLDINTFLRNDAESDRFQQMLIEQFLVRVDNGWILRRAQFYRGAYQDEDEREGARQLLLRLTGKPSWLDHRFLVLRTAAALLPHGADTSSVQKIRQLSASLSNRDPPFKSLRNKIHGNPELADAGAVREYAKNTVNQRLIKDYAELVNLIEQVYAADIARQLRELAAADTKQGPIASLAKRARENLQSAGTAREKFKILSQMLFELRRNLPSSEKTQLKLAILDTSLMLESELFTVAGTLNKELHLLSRAARLAVLGDNLRALFGAGLLSGRQVDAGETEIAALLATSTPDVAAYKRTLDYLSLVPHWATQSLRQFFGDGMAKLSEIEPTAELFIQDHLRGSPMFFYANLIDSLVRDANQLAGVKSELFGTDAGAGLRGLNPGLARGPLRIALGTDIAALNTDGIYLLPETVSELPPVAGILTAGEGNPLSHVQLLARNLGIPNVGVDQDQIAILKQHAGDTVLLAVSPAGSIRLSSDPSAIAEAFPAVDKPTATSALIEVDLAKLDLTQRNFLTLSELRATDSGRVVGPKAAKLGELKHHYPEAVAEGLAIPFGIFKDILEQPYANSTMTLFTWMRQQYAALATMAVNGEQRQRATEAFRKKLQSALLNADPGAEFKQRLSAKLIEVFGPDRTFGVFVRSDTNVEDLPGFTGAGLNLTVPNVVGIDNIIAAVSKVWASPFSARSFAWRQTLMDKPEHVYPAVLLMLSVDADKSGVLVTQDIDTGDNTWLSVATNEGVGGAVDGQSAESLRINTLSSDVRLMASATASIRRKVDLKGGVRKIPVSTAERVLLDGEIQQLIALAKELPSRFPAIVDAHGEPAPADIEFGFLNGELRLFQIRPFLDSDQARGNDYLRMLDAPLAMRATAPVDMTVAP